MRLFNIIGIGSLLLSVIGLPRMAAAAGCQRLAIPAYFYPGALWNQATDGTPTVSILTMNPASGPGTGSNSDYVAAVAKAQNASVRVIGYVHTSYGARPISQVESEVDKYKAWYHVDGIFVDEVSSSVNQLAYYTALAKYIGLTPGRLVVLNPGTIPDQSYMNVGDIVLVFEGNFASYQTAVFPGWMSSYPSSRFWHLIYGVADATQMATVQTLSEQRNAGYLYITDDDLPNPWDTLASYWSTEVSALVSGCQP